MAQPSSSLDIVFIAAVSLALTPPCLLAQGGVRKLESEAELGNFSETAVALTFRGLSEGAGARDVLAEWGLQFQGAAGSAPTIGIREYFVGLNDFPSLVPVLLNRSETGVSEDIPLILNLLSPARGIGLYLANGDQDSVVTITAFDPQGAELGTVQQQGLTSGLMPPTFVGLEALEGRTLGKLVIDYGGSPNPEEVDSLFVDFATSPRFRTYLAQFADGTFADGSLRTQIVLTNASAASPAEGSLTLLDGQGDPVQTTLNGVPGDSFPFSIRRHRTVVFESDGLSDPPLAAYARVEANAPVQVSAVYRVLDRTGRLVAETGIDGDEARFLYVGIVQAEPARDLNSGIAIANLGTEAARVELDLFDLDGVPLIRPQPPALELEAGQHRALFLDELFPGLMVPEDGLAATLVASGNQPLALTILRTIGGVVSASSRPSGPRP